MHSTVIKIPIVVFISLVASIVLLKVLPLLIGNPYFLLALPVAMVCMFLMVRNTKKMLVLVVFSRALIEPLLIMSRFGGSGMGIGAALNLFVILIGLTFFLKDFNEFKRLEPVKYWLVFLLVCLLTIPFAFDRIAAIRLFLNFVTYMCMGLLPFFIIKKPKDKIFWVKLLLISTFLPVMWANVDLLRGGTHNSGINVMRVQGTFNHPNQLAFYLTFVMVLIFIILKDREFPVKSFHRKWLILYLLNLFVLLIATYTRSAWIALWTLMVIYGLMKERKFLFPTLCLPVFLFLIPVIRDRVMDLFQEGDRLNSFAWRVEVWESSFSQWRQRPWLGYGLASFLPRSTIFYQGASEQGAGAHSVYIQLLFEMGIVGLFTYLMVFFCYLKKFWSAAVHLSQSQAAQYAIIFAYTFSYLVISASDNLLYYLTFNWYFLFFIAVFLKGLDFKQRNRMVIKRNL